jgi:hypothetical protein
MFNELRAVLLGQVHILLIYEDLSWSDFYFVAIVVYPKVGVNKLAQAIEKVGFVARQFAL